MGKLRERLDNTELLFRERPVGMQGEAVVDPNDERWDVIKRLHQLYEQSVEVYFGDSAPDFAELAS